MVFVRTKIPDVAFVANGQGTYEMWIGGRIGDIAVPEEEIDDALRRRRLPNDTTVHIIDVHGRAEVWHHR